MPQTLVVGDIHGCCEELLDLLDAAGLGDGDRVLSVGDLVDRGPEEARVLGFFRGRPDAAAILGNHEQKHLRWRAGELEPATSQVLCREALGDAAWHDACDWFATLPRWAHLGDALVVHGFFLPGLPVEAQHPTVITGTLSGERRVREAVGERWWEAYDGDVPLIVGHLDYNADGTPLIWRDRVYAIDTGCVHGLRLTGVLVPSFRVVSVKARDDHWSRRLQAP